MSDFEEKNLDDQLFQKLVCERPNLDLDFELSQSLSGSIWRTIPHGHKWIHYFPIYDQEFASLRGRDVKILEIGVYKGGSLQLWKKFFGSKSKIVGLDIDSNCKQYENHKSNIFVEVGSQADPFFLREIIDKYGEFDLIIDDGSHIVSHQLISFKSLFLDALKDGGKYFIEDLEGNYWDNGLKDRDFTMIDFLKTFIDYQNEIYDNSSYSRFFYGGSELQNSFIISRISTLLNKLSFYKGVAVVSKGIQSPPLGVHL